MIKIIKEEDNFFSIPQSIQGQPIMEALIMRSAPQKPQKVSINVCSNFDEEKSCSVQTQNTSPQTPDTSQDNAPETEK